eukprot:scaffold820_cov376-Prasinococcus_capsulatus_cf.AAC.26
MPAAVPTSSRKPLHEVQDAGWPPTPRYWNARQPMWPTKSDCVPFVSISWKAPYSRAVGPNTLAILKRLSSGSAFQASYSVR